ncbi:MAG: helix-turn-helix domain-containing protein [Clostridia bacterium]|nr:helix-turn-helix domain-containing protein [Clostridia bacterium]
MQERNICKFISEPISEQLLVSHFIFETKLDMMGQGITLEQHRAILMTKGSGELLIGGHRIACSVGDLIFGFRGERFQMKGHAGCEFLYISFWGARAEELFRRFSIKPLNRCFRGFDGLIPIWHESLSRASEETIDLAAESMLLYTFSRLVSEAGEQNAVINRVIAFSEKRFTDPALSLATLAEELGYNAKYLSHLFKERMGLGYAEYLRSLRVKFAVSLFDHGIDSVKNVAALSGFSDPLYFSTVFKKTVGVSPKEYKTKK